MMCDHEGENGGVGRGIPAFNSIRQDDSMQGRAGSVYDSHLIVFSVIYEEKGLENKS